MTPRNEVHVRIVQGEVLVVSWMLEDGTRHVQRVTCPPAAVRAARMTDEELLLEGDPLASQPRGDLQSPATRTLRRRTT